MNYAYIFFGVVLGLIMGVVTTIFGQVLIYVSHVRDMHKIVIYALPIIGIIIYYVYGIYGVPLKKGMKLLKDSYYNEEINIPKRLVPFITVSTWATHLFGGSVGREGVAVQIGAAISNMSYKCFKIDKKSALIAGMASGFAGLFGTPMAAIVFPLEILTSKVIQVNTLIVTVISSFIAAKVSEHLGLYHFKFHVDVTDYFSIKILLVCILASILFGLSGIVFERMVKFLKPKLSKNILTVVIGSIILTLVIINVNNARFSGLGTNLIYQSFKNNGATILSYDFLLKIVFTTVTIALGYQGGEVTPLFAIGSSLGAVVAMFFGVPVYLIAALGYCTVFSAATNTVITPMLIGYEVFGPAIIPYIILSSIIVKFVSGKTSIY